MPLEIKTAALRETFLQMSSAASEKEEAPFQGSVTKANTKKPFSVYGSLLQEIFSAVIIPLLSLWSD